MLKLVYKQDNTQIDKVVKDIKKSNDDNNNLFKKYKDEGLVSKADEILFNQLENDMKTYVNDYEGVIKLVNENNYKEANEKFANMTAIRLQLFSDIDNILNLNIDEVGRGFAVVADEVRKLAEQSTETIDNIQNMVAQVQDAFNNLSRSGQDILNFIDDNVKSNFELLLNTGIQYEKDGEVMDNIVSEISSSTKQINHVIEQVSSAMQNVSATAEESAGGSEEILSSISEITNSVKTVEQSTKRQVKLVDKLNKMIQQFKI